MKQQRQAGYWPGYHAARASEKDFVIGYVKDLVWENPPPEPVRKSRRGRPKVYPRAEMAVACILMNHFNISSYDTKNAIASWNLDLDGRVPSTSTILRAHEELDMQWLQDMVATTAKACLEKAGIGEAIEVDSAADSTGVETDRYEDKVKLDKKTGKETVARAKSYLKWHIFAVLKLQIILSCAMTPSSVADTDMLRPLLEKSKKLGRSFAGWWFHADRGYDSDSNCEAVFGMGMRPNILQRKSRENGGNRRDVGKRFRRRAAAMFDGVRYGKRRMVEGIFGAEETRSHRLLCRYRKKETQERFGVLLAITWNVRALNRIRCAAEPAVMPAAA